MREQDDRAMIDMQMFLVVAKEAGFECFLCFAALNFHSLMEDGREHGS